ASAFPCSAASLSQFTPESVSFAVLAVIKYDIPNRYCPTAFPCSAERVNHSIAAGILAGIDSTKPSE
ncbi:hypothetical protein L6232_22815, partial [Shewanella sp. C31]|nr:hypothetical protein [Shewanella electrica]